MFTTLSGMALAADIPLPQPVPDRIGRAQVFAYKIKDRQALRGKRDIIWGDEGPKIEGIYSLRYMMTDRDPERKHDVAWHKTHHPEWISYKSDRESPAHEFKYYYGYDTPVDVANPAVRDYLFDVNVRPVVGTGRYEGVAVDNVHSTNGWQRAGVWRQDGWRQQYSGARVDPAYARDTADWMRWLATRVHAAGMSLVLNLYPNNHRTGLDDQTGYRLIAEEADIILDEHGYTRKGKPIVTDKTWLEYVSLFADLARTKGVIVDDQIAANRAQVTPAVINWALANYLLVKGDRTYVAWLLDDAAAELNDFPELYLPIGRPREEFVRVGDVYQRRFEKVIALVNPASKASATYRVPPGEWHDLAGAELSGTVNLPPASGLVLVSGTPR